MVSVPALSAECRSGGRDIVAIARATREIDLRYAVAPRQVPREVCMPRPAHLPALAKGGAGGAAGPVSPVSEGGIR
jgi:hypothetical protein